MKLFTRTSTRALVFALSTTAVFVATSASARNTYQNVEVAFVLDTTGSMSGLIEGAKQKIWSIANQIIDVESDGQTKVRFALIGYRDRGDAYVTRTYDMTDDIHGIYGDLLEFRAQGGGDRPESVNQALLEAVDDINWSRGSQTLRMVFLVGDAPPHMDYANDSHYPQTIIRANKRNIIVNTVLAGNDRETALIWRNMAKLGQGDYVAIPQDGGMQIIQSPYDQDIEVLQRRINKTSLGYGSVRERKDFQSKQSRAMAAPSSVSSDMAEFRLKSGKQNQVITGVNELVEDYEDGTIELGSVAEEALPDELKDLSKEERKTKVEALVAQRAELNGKLQKLVKQRATYVDAKRKELATIKGDDSFDSQVRKSITRQMKMK